MIYRNRAIDSLYVSFLDENFAGFCTEGLHFVLLDDLAALELLNLSVEITVLTHCADEISRN